MSKVPQDGPALDGRHLAEKDAADLLYRYGSGGVAVSILASSGLAFSCIGQASSRTLLIWWGLMTSVLLWRCADIYRYRLKEISIRGGQQAMRHFGYGLIVTAALWGAFPLLFFSDLTLAGKACTAIVLSGMVGGSATVLSPSRTLAGIYCAALALPPSILFLFLPGVENKFLGILGCVFLVVMSRSSRVAHEATMTAVRLSRANEALVVQMALEQQRTEAASVHLKAAQSALYEANLSLENRIKARTAELEREIRKKERYSKELAQMASVDSLTGLCNRAALATRLDKALAAADSAGQQVAILFIDLDRFKEVNDAMGHFAGDRVLQVVAQRLSCCVTNGLDLARLGGDEFVVAISGVQSAAAALELGTTLLKQIREPIDIDLTQVTINATAGLALFPEHGRTQDELIRAADVAMCAAKEGKRAKIQLFDPSLAQRLAERHQLEQALREAIATGAMSLLFQPIIAADNGRCQAIEALLRWNHPERGPILPAEFIPLAERSGEIVSIGRWVLREACREAFSWGGVTAQPIVSVNVSAAQFLAGTLVPDVMAALADSGLPGHRLQLEITESLFAGDQRSITPTLRELRKKGIRIALDDFGTGFSCLAYLRDLPLDLIKIDKSFVDAVDTDSFPIVKAILTIAKTFGLEVVGEGVETAAQARILIRMGAEYLQGHLFSKALSPEMTRAWLAAREPTDAPRVHALAV